MLGSTKAKGRQASGPRGRRKVRATPYHHGSLEAALLDAAERIMEEKGTHGLTLRAAAREAGVSHAAPKNHFGDLTGLLSELAARGYERFCAMMVGDVRATDTPMQRIQAIGRAYVGFARASRHVHAHVPQRAPGHEASGAPRRCSCCTAGLDRCCGRGTTRKRRTYPNAAAGRRHRCSMVACPRFCDAAPGWSVEHRPGTHASWHKRGHAIGSDLDRASSWSSG
jgi:AcrR family transcriptional regulator